MNQEWENPFSIGTNENNETVIRLGGQLASKRTFNNIEEAKQYIVIVTGKQHSEQSVRKEEMPKKKNTKNQRSNNEKPLKNIS